MTHSHVALGRFDKDPGEAEELGLDTSQQSVTESSKGLWLSAVPDQQPATTTLITGTHSSPPPESAAKTNNLQIKVSP